MLLESGSFGGVNGLWPVGGALCPRPGLASLRLCRLCLPNQHISAAQAPSQLMVTVLHDARGEAFPPLYLPAQVSWLF